MKAVIFDLDGVIVDTAIYHYLAWKKLAGDLGFEFEQIHNERQKGVSRLQSLEVLLEAGNIRGLSEEEKLKLANTKNNYYLEMIAQIDASAILPGIVDFLKEIKSKGYKTALGSASRSGGRIIDRIGLKDYFDVIVDGNLVTKAKPDPEVFKKGADLLKVSYGDCIVIEDARAGVEAAKSAGMKCIGIGKRDHLQEADIVISDTKELMKCHL